MKTATKTIAFLMVAIIIASVSIGCSANNAASSSSVASSAASGTAASGSDAPQAQTEEKNYDKRLKLTMGINGGIEGYDYTAGDAYAKYWSDRYNWDVDMVLIPSDQWNDMIRIWASSRDLPDVTTFNYTNTTHPDMATFVEQELVKRMPDDWREKWPLAAAVFDKTGLGPMTEEAFGGVYCLPRARFADNVPGDPVPLLNHMGIGIRKDWAEAVGFEVKSAYTLSELVEYGKLVKEADPSGLGDNLAPLSFTPGNAYNVFIGFNNTYHNSWYKDENGQYQWGAARPETLEGLKLYYEAYTSGALYPEFYTLKGSEDADMFRVTGTSGGWYKGGTSTGFQVDLVARFAANTGLPADYCHTAVVLGEDGKYHQQDLINFWCALIFSPEMDEELFERFMDMLEFGCTEEGYIIQTCGIEGESFEWRNGEIVNLLPEGMPLEGREGKYPSMGYNLGCLKLWDDFSFMNPNVTPNYRELSWDLYMTRLEYATPETFPPCDWTVYTHDSPDRRRAAFDFATEYANMVVSSKSVQELENSWNQWIASQQAIVQPVIDELNAKA